MGTYSRSRWKKEREVKATAAAACASPPIPFMSVNAASLSHLPASIKAYPWSSISAFFPRAAQPREIGGELKKVKTR